MRSRLHRGLLVLAILLGVVLVAALPAAEPELRVTAVESVGMTVSDMDRALAEYHVSGVRTTLPVLRRILRHPDFAAGRLDTHFMERLPAGRADDSRRSLAIIAAVLEAYERAGRPAELPAAQGVSPWARAGRPGGGSSWRSR